MKAPGRESANPEAMTGRTKLAFLRRERKESRIWATLCNEGDGDGGLETEEDCGTVRIIWMLVFAEGRATNQVGDCFKNKFKY